MAATNSNTGRPERAACLYRNSDDRQENSVGRQKDGVTPYARRRGYEVVAEYTFDGVPGDEIKFHPDWQRLLKDAGKRWTVLVMDEPSRLSREDPDEFVAEVKLPLKRAGVRADSVTKGPLDWDTIAGDILTLVHAHKAREEVRDLSRRTLGGMARRAREGRFFGWMPPYGLRVERDVDPASGKVLARRVVLGPDEEVRAVRFIFDAVANKGWSLRRVCRELKARGVRPPRGNGLGSNKQSGHWGMPTVRKILKNRKYVGDLPWNETNQGKYSYLAGGQVAKHDQLNRRTSRNASPDVIVVEGHPDVPALIDRDLFARVQAALAGKQKCCSPNADDNHYLFTHLLVCGDCGAYLTGQPDHGRRAYICSRYKRYGAGAGACWRNRVAEADVWAAVLGALKDDILSPKRLDEVEAEVERRLEAERSSGEAERLRGRLGQLARDIGTGNRNLLLVDADRIPGLQAALKELEQEQARLEGHLAELEGDTSQSKAALDEARRQLWRLRESLEGDDLEAQSVVVREVVSKVEVRFERQTKKHGRRSTTGRARTFSLPAGLVVHVRPGLGQSEWDISGRRRSSR
jgi:DNA invertase Pin-like site-specific DNA recombinase